MERTPAGGWPGLVGGEHTRDSPATMSIGCRRVGGRGRLTGRLTANYRKCIGGIKRAVGSETEGAVPGVRGLMPTRREKRGVEQAASVPLDSGKNCLFGVNAGQLAALTVGGTPPRIGARVARASAARTSGDE
jgi:hypothetical protein